MNYLDVRHFGEAIVKRFAKFQRAFWVHSPLTTHKTLAFETVVFTQEDLQDIAFYLSSCNVLVNTWSLHTPSAGQPFMIVTLYLSEVQKNGQSENH